MPISVVIPTFRRPEMLDELLERLAPQLDALPDAEAIVVDNCPDASALAPVERWAQGREGRLRYAHERNAGVVHARNRGVAEARRDHVVFLDDDEVPSPAWLASFAAQARAGVEMASGRIAPRFVGAPPAGLEPLLRQLFSRELGVATGADVSERWIRLGTGNSMFRRDCFASDPPFDVRFNATGGEDLWLISALRARGVPLRWNQEALVEEVVPPGRMTIDYLKARKFNQGQLRCVFMLGPEPTLRSRLRLALWMGVGLAQATLWGAAAGAFRLLGSPRHGDAVTRAYAGLGKLFWRKRAGAHYSA